ncbi:MAG: hypothetical protein AAF721_12745 [Myxococcota bacterium]
MSSVPFSLVTPALAALAATVALGGCGDTEPLAAGDDAGSSEGGDGAVDTGVDEPADDGSEGGSADDGAAPAAVGSCTYVSPFTQGTECRQYFGDGWTTDAIAAECEGLAGDVAIAESCDAGGTLGTCVLDDDPDRVTEILAYGDDAGSCSAQATGCETFGGGTWEPAGVCAGGDDPPPPSGGSVFIQPTLQCRDALPGEPPGLTDGQVCTWESISGCTEEGRAFQDYASCDVIYTQRPYYPAPAAEPPEVPDERLNDPEYAAELAWVTEQVEASACVCCHSTATAPNGPSNWYLEAPGNWIDSFYDSGLAMNAGWVDSTAFGAYPAEENNGFHRDASGLPTTDSARMIAFFEAELARRGLTPADFVDTKPFGGPLYDQMIYEPEACENGEGVDDDGTLRWEGGAARYIYVLEADASSPTVPPNLDIPEGTRWRIDVPSDGSPIAAGDVTYGQLPSGTDQRVPANGPAQALVDGEDYYLYVTADVGIPITRCVFRYGG